MKNKAPLSSNPGASSTDAKAKKSGGSSAAATPAAPVKAPVPPRALTHEEISARARQIWEQRGRPEGQDETIWYEAERQLRGDELRTTEAGRFSNSSAILDSDGEPNDDLDQRLNEIASPSRGRSATSL